MAGAFVCVVCGVAHRPDEHVCDPDVVIRRIDDLDTESRSARRRLRRVRAEATDLARRITRSTVAVPDFWFGRLLGASFPGVGASPGRWRSAEDVIEAAFDLFRDLDTPRERIARLREACERFKKSSGRCDTLLAVDEVADNER